jgi:transglutaminase-like putative cysteine protease
MRLQIEHVTVFTYDQPISEAYTEMRLRPLDAGGQRCLSFAISPQPREEVRQYVDRFGNGVHHFDLMSPHRQLVVMASSHVLTPDSFQPETDEIGLLDEFDYCRPTDYTPYSAAVAEFAAAQAVPGDPLATAMALTAAVHGALIYEKGVTDVQTTAGQALALGRGVCQDFTHVMLAACRSLDLPARYVSGYLYNDGQTAASHAWVDVHVPGPGWVSLDPTHNRQQSGQYVRVAIGRDYGDVPPTRGVFKGQAKETLEVRVSVTAL